MTHPDSRGDGNAPCTARTSVGATVVVAVAIAMAVLVVRWLG